MKFASAPRDKDQLLIKLIDKINISDEVEDFAAILVGLCRYGFDRKEAIEFLKTKVITGDKMGNQFNVKNKMRRNRVDTAAQYVRFKKD